MKIALIFFLILASVWALPNSARIVGGRPANVGSFPYAAAVYKSTSNGNYFCGGALLSDSWTITSGQCVDGATSFRILLGITRLNETGETVQQLATDEYVLHPDFNPLTLENDLGLIKFRMPITFNLYVQKVYLPTWDMSESATGQAFGWGQVSDDDSQLSNHLNYVNLQRLPDAECKRVYGNQIVGHLACFAGYYNEGTCIGDTGSPITQFMGKFTDVVQGVASFVSGNGCESTDPSGYTLVFPYVQWITNVTGVQ